MIIVGNLIFLCTIRCVINWETVLFPHAAVYQATGLNWQMYNKLGFQFGIAVTIIIYCFKNDYIYTK